MTFRLQGPALDDRFRRAETHFSRGMYSLAADELEAALKASAHRTRDQDFELRWRYATCLARLGRAEEAGAQVDEALSVLDLTKWQTARLEALRGFNAFSRGDYPLAREICERAAATLRDEADHEGLTSDLRWLSMTHLRLGDLEPAFENAYTALAEARHADLPVEIGHAHGLLAVAFIQRGQYDAAREHGKEALAIAEHLKHQSGIIRHNLHLSIASRLAGDLDLAANYAHRALATAEESDSGNLVISARLAAGRALKESGRVDAARKLVEGALAIARSGERERDKVLILEDLGDLDVLDGDVRGGLEKYRRAWQKASELAAEGDLVAELGWRIGQALLDLGDAEGARPWIEKSLEVGRKAGERKEYAVALRARARWFAAAGRTAEGRRDFEEALSILESLSVPCEIAGTHLAFARALADSTESRKFGAECGVHLAAARSLYERVGSIHGLAAVDDAQAFLDAIGPAEAAPTPSLAELRPRHSGLLSRTWTAPAFLATLDECRKLGPTSLPLLLVGDTGTGKTLLAEALHELGRPDQGGFFQVNCAALPDHLHESELFGHQKGAFTGAEREHPGIFREAGQGTVFLDEIDKTSLQFQAKLLQVLDSREIRPVGSTRVVTIEARIVCATNRDLSKLVAEGGFLEDLHHRLTCGIIHVPALADRIEDLRTLSRILLEDIGQLERTPVPEITDDGWAVLVAHHWPGNVRELKSLLHRAVALNRAEPRLDAELILKSAPLGSSLRRPGEKRTRRATNGAADLAHRLKGAERTEILRALERTGGVRRKAAELLGISYRGLNKKMARLGIDAETIRATANPEPDAG